MNRFLWMLVLETMMAHEHVFVDADSEDKGGS